MTKRWKEEARRNSYRRRAKSEGYRSRAAYKLLEVNNKFRLIRRGNIVVELGAWPGGMSQAAARLVGPEGLVVAVDIRKFKEFEEPNIITLELDILEDDVAEAVLETLGGKRADVLISDASPRFTGVRDVDVMRQMELTERSFQLSLEILRRDGSAMLKAFECSELRELEQEINRMYRRVRRFIPSATKKTSSELYLIAQERL